MAPPFAYAPHRGICRMVRWRSYDMIMMIVRGGCRVSNLKNIWRRSLSMTAVAALSAGTASAATRTYIVTDFDSIRVEGPLNVAIETGRGASARGEGSATSLDQVDLRVTARVLTVRLKPSPFESARDRNAPPVRLSLTVPSLRKVQLTGAGSLHATGLDKSRADIIATGSGSITITAIDTDTLSLAQFGAGSVTLAGKAKSVDLRVSGNGGLDARNLRAADLELALEGAASVEAQAERSAKIVAAGPGNATITGSPGCTVRRVGSGVVRCGGNIF